MMLAAYLTSGKAEPTALSEPVVAPGWKVALRAPAGWSDGGEVLGPHRGHLRVFESPRGTRQLLFGRMEAESGTTAEDLCRDLLSQRFEGLPISLDNARVRSVPVGTWPAVEVDWVPEFMGEVLGSRIIMLAVVVRDDLDANEAYVLEMRTDAIRSSRDDDLWKRLIDGIEVQAE
jgi:hypothetical protein